MQLLPKKFINHPLASNKAFFTVIILIIWSFFLWRSFGAFDPSSTYSSDSAIPVLMSNDERPITVYNLYYYGTDRWGGWPFLVAQGIRRLTGYRWSDQSLFIMQAIWVFLGALVIAALSRRDRLAVMLVYLIVLCLHAVAQLRIFALSQVYAWQITALLFGWYSLRRLFDNHLEPSEKLPNRKRNLWRFLTFGFSFLAIWSSAASAPILFFLLGLEALRAYLKREKAADGKSFFKQFINGGLLIGAATFLEMVVKLNFHRHSLKHYGHDFDTPFELDTGYFTQNLKIHLEHISKLPWWPLYLLAALAVLLLICCFVYAYLRKKRELLERLRAVFVNDTVILAIGACAIAVINFVLVVLVSHVRFNAYDDRFLTLTNLFGPVSGLLIIFLIFDLASKSSEKPMRLSIYARPAFIVTALLLLIFKFPFIPPHPLYPVFHETATALSQKAPRAILMGGYWEAYVFPSLQPTNTMTPVPLEGHLDRMPWTRKLLQRADQVVVEYRRGGLVKPEASPPERLSQYGVPLRLIDPKLYENGEYAFALYVNENRQPSAP